MPLFLNLYRDGGALVEDQPAGDSSVEIPTDQRAAKCLTALMDATQSFEVAHSLASLVMAGIRLAEKDARRKRVRRG